jgi:hypothetical protein
MTDFPNFENLDDRIQFRITHSEREELYRLAGDKAPEWARWGIQQALKALRERYPQESKQEPLAEKAS